MQALVCVDHRVIRGGSTLGEVLLVEKSPLISPLDECGEIGVAFPLEFIHMLLLVVSLLSAVWLVEVVLKLRFPASSTGLRKIATYVGLVGCCCEVEDA